MVFEKLVLGSRHRPCQPDFHSRRAQWEKNRVMCDEKANVFARRMLERLDVVTKSDLVELTQHACS